jgi:putative endonuclease
MAYYVYITASKSGVLYTGVTNNLERRTQQHKEGAGGQFTSRYHVAKLVYFEEATDPKAAIEREKQIKGWLRARKVALIEALNPNWRDLSRDWTALAPLRDASVRPPNPTSTPAPSA